MNGQRDAPLRTRGVDEEEAQADVAGNHVTGTNHGAVHADEEAANLGRRNLALVQGHQCDERAWLTTVSTLRRRLRLGSQS